MKKLIVILFLICSTSVYSQTGGFAGSFVRMGFGSRGISMGNAMTSVTRGDVVGYYNPALSSFQNEHLINLSYSFLSFDRTLNFVSYTKNFKLPKQEQGGAGITISWINAGVGKIDGRDNDGFHTEDYSVSENQFNFAPSIKVSDKLSLGIGFKFYYSKIFTGVKSTSLGFDLGAVFAINEKMNAAFTVKDIGSKYSWNTNDLYGQYGNTTVDKFPQLFTFGLSYLLPKNFGLVAVDFEITHKSSPDSLKLSGIVSSVIRMGIEITPVKNFTFRGGFDRFDFKSSDKFGNAKAMFGIGYQRPLKNFIIGLDYSFVMEPYSNKPFQSLTAIFKIK